MITPYPRIGDPINELTAIDRVIRRRDDAHRDLSPDEEAAAQRRIAADRDRLAVDIGIRPIDLPPMVDAPRRRVDVEDLLRRRAGGTLDIIEITDEEAIALGLRQAPPLAPLTRLMRFRAWLRRIGAFLRGDVT